MLPATARANRPWLFVVADFHVMSALGHSLPTHPAPAPTFIRC